MNSLCDFKVLLDKHKIKGDSCGWYVVVGGDRWTLAHDQLFLNGNPQSKQEITEYLRTGPKAPIRRAKMIVPKEGYENVSDCIEDTIG